MSTTSDQYALPYPDGTDQVAVAADVKGLAVKSGVELGGVEDRANAYADAGDTATLTSAESYADTGDSTTLTSAKSYADTGDSTTLTSAKGYTDTAMKTVEWYRGGLNGTFPVNEPLGSDIKDGEYRVTIDSTAVDLGLPGGRAGKLTKVSYGTFAFETYVSLAGFAVRLWSDSSQLWGDWIFPEQNHTSTAITEALNTHTPSGVKRVPLALTLGHGGTAHNVTDGTLRIPMEWGAPVTRWRVHIRNINPRENAVHTGAVDFPQGLYVGDDAEDGQIAAPTQVVGAFTTPANGDGWVSGWIDHELPARSKHLLSFAYTASNTIVSNVGGSWAATGHVADSTTATWTQEIMTPLDIWVEAETPTMTPVVAVIGDSLSAGTGSTVPVVDSAISQHLREWGGLPVHYAHAGDTFNSYNGAGAAGSEDYKKNRWLDLARPDSVLLALGTNDIFGHGVDLATVQARALETLEWVTDALSDVVFAATIPPRTGVTGTAEDVRRAYNTWLVGQDKPGGFARGDFPFADAVSTDDENIVPEYDADTIHLTTAGYAAQAATLHGLSSHAPQWELSAPPEWVDLSAYLVNGWTGSIKALVVGDVVEYAVEGLDGRSSTSNTVTTALPAWARPKPTPGYVRRDVLTSTDIPVRLAFHPVDGSLAASKSGAGLNAALYGGFQVTSA